VVRAKRSHGHWSLANGPTGTQYSINSQPFDRWSIFYHLYNEIIACTTSAKYIGVYSSDV
jgi:hypothetical protein